MTETPPKEAAAETIATSKAEIAPESGPSANAAAALSKEQLEQLKGRLLAAKFGDMVTLMMQSSLHQDVPLGQLRNRLIPPLLRQQYLIAEARKKDSGEVVPVGMLLWAKVSDEVHARLAGSVKEPILLEAEEWSNGDHYWIVDAIGSQKHLTALLTDLRMRALRGCRIHYRAHSEEGAVMKVIEAEAEPAQPGDEASSEES